MKEELTPEEYVLILEILNQYRMEFTGVFDDGPERERVILKVKRILVSNSLGISK